jgi:hypothetical protein
MTRRMTIVFVLTLLLGCESAESRCNAARVEAHDAWEAWAVRSEEARTRAESMRRECVSGPTDGECLREAGRAELAAGPPARDLRRVRDRAADGALAFRDAVSRFRDDFSITAADAVEERAFTAATAHWDACHQVSP